MATLILRETYLALEKEMKSIDKLRTETALKTVSRGLDVSTLLYINALHL